MKTKHPELSPELLRRILPALRAMGRYPTKTAKVISTETGIELAEIYAYTERHGRPKAKDIEQLERQAMDEAPPPPIRLQPAPTKAETATRPVGNRAGMTHAATQAVAKASLHSEPPPAGQAPAAPSEPPTEVQDPWVGKRVDLDAVKRYLPVLERLHADPTMSQVKACQQAGLRGSQAFVIWKNRLLGKGRVHPAAYARFIKWVNSQPAKPATKPAPAAAPERRGPPSTPRHSARNSDNCALARRLLAKAGACLAAANELLRDETDGLEDGGAE